MSKLQKTEAELLSVYQKVNPSTYHIESNAQEYAHREKYFRSLFHKRLCFPKKMFQGADLIEFGSGTGEHSLFYLLWGATGTFVEINDQAIERMEKLFKHFKLPEDRYMTVTQSIFEFEPEKKWDIVATVGVLHHLEEKERAFSIAADCVAPGGYLLLGIGNDAGCFQRNLQRLIINRLAGSDDEKIEEVANMLFTEHLDRAERFGHRSRRAIIYDTWVNPKIDAMSVSDVLEAMHANGLEFYSSWPPIRSSVLGDSPNHPLEQPLAHVKTASLPEAVWLAHRDDDSTTLDQIEKEVAPMMQSIRDLAGALNDVTAENKLEPGEILDLAESVRQSLGEAPNPWGVAIDQLAILLHEVTELMTLLSEGDIHRIADYLKTTQALFRGTAGLGITYYVAHRPEASSLDG